MKRKKTVLALLVAAVAILLPGRVLAVPTFQTYIEGATAGDYGQDQDTWFINESTFNLRVVGAYGPQTISLSEVTLLISVPEGETGSISITAPDGASYSDPLLLTSPTPTSISGVYNPDTDADVDLLTDVTGYDGYLTKDFLPDDVTFNNHYPLQNDVSDFLIYSIGELEDLGPIHNYNADNGGEITEEGTGEERVFEVSVSGFSWAHFDAYGYDEQNINNRVFKATWEINPGSHDATYIPVPGAVLLGGIGVALVGWLRRRTAL